MSNNDENLKPNTRSVKKKGKVLLVLREIFSIVFWSYTICKLFVFDIDIYLLNKFFPNYSFVVNYKFLGLLIFLSFVVVFFTNKQIFLGLIYVLFYPAILLIYRFPFFIFKRQSWNYAFMVFDLILGFFKEWKNKIVFITLFISSLFGILSSSNKIILWISIIFVLSLLFWSYFKKFLTIFKPIGIYNLYTKLFSKYQDLLYSASSKNLEKYSASKNERTILNYDDMDDEQSNLWFSDIQQLIVYNRVCLFFANKVKNYQKSKYNLIIMIISVFALIVFTVFSFTLINFGLYKINNGYFLFQITPSFFTFIYFSFSILINNQINDLIANSQTSQIFIMIESAFIYFLGALGLSFLFTFKEQKANNEIDDVITELNNYGDNAESYIRDTYFFDNIESALYELKNKGFSVDFLINFSKAI